MTAEIAIANGSAVAMAADSAVTIGDKRIYNSAVKLFALSKTEPVGIMVYGNANLLDVPWETIIKECRKKLSGKKFSALKMYAEFLIDFIVESKQFFSEESINGWIADSSRDYLKDLIVENIKGKLKEEISEDDVDDVAIKKANKILDQVVVSHKTMIEARDMLPGFSQEDFSKIKQEKKFIFDDVVREILPNFVIKKKTLDNLYSIFVGLLSRNVFSSMSSGIVVSGFGEEEIFPSIETYEIEGIVCNKIKCKRSDDKSKGIKGASSSIIMPFAQDDMVSSFMQGVSPDIYSAFNDEINGALDVIFDPDMPEDSDEDIKEQAAELRNSLRDRIINNIASKMHNNHVKPVVRMVTSLPKDELANMAEALVSLTAFKRRMTGSLETVGGPVDVLVISKGDGLVWINRKHYFPKEINHSFYSNYFKGVCE